MRRAVVLLAALAHPSLASAADVFAPNPNLVVDGVPPIPASMAAKAAAYNDARPAAFESWHPVRRELLITTRFADVAQVHRVKMPGGARTQLTFFPEPISTALYPPDALRGDHFVFSKDVGGGEFYQLYRYDVATAAVTLLTDGKSRNTLGVFSRAGDRLAYQSTRRNGKDNDIWVIDPRDPKSEKLVAEVTGGGWQALDFSPDGKKLLVGEFLSVNESHLWLLDLASGNKQQLTDRGNDKVVYEGGKFTADGKGVYTVTDKVSEFVRLAVVYLKTKGHKYVTGHIPWDVDGFSVSRDRRTIAVVTNEDGTGVLRLFDGKTLKEFPKPATPPGTVTAASFHPNSRDLAFSVTSTKTPNDVYSLDIRTGKMDRWTESETGGIDVSQTPEPEIVKWKSFDERTISGYLYKPPARFTGKRPVMISIHGGPESQARPLYPGRNRYFLDELGVAILYPNVRGSTGYGKTFTKLDNGKLREDSVKDIGALLDWLKTRPDLDADRVMVYGGSYGGYMTLAVSARYAARIRCSMDVVGISNFVSFLERTEAYRRDLRRVEYGDERDADMRAFLTKISPLTNAKSITKPIFIVQGKNDPRVPQFEAEQIVATLKKQKTPVWYLLANDEGHGFAKKRNVDYLFAAQVAFVQAHLLK